jgi:hypothetical protein
MAEDFVHGNISCPNGDRRDIRQRNWAAAMTGTYVMVLGMDIENTPSAWLKDCRILQKFFESTSYNRMRSTDPLAAGETDYVLANEYYDYILYALNAHNELGIKHIAKGTYSLGWLDCISGNNIYIEKGITATGQCKFSIPEGFGVEVALYIHREDKRPKRAMDFQFKERRGVDKAIEIPVVSDIIIHGKVNQQLYIQLAFTDPDGGPGPYTIKILDGPRHGTLTGEGNDRYYEPHADYRGEDSFSWKVYDGLNSSELSRVKITIE